jgi:hypothetical protein
VGRDVPLSLIIKESKVVMRILYIPLDERPCNEKFPGMISQIASEVDFVSPPFSMYGEKKIKTDTEELWNWIYRNIDGCDYAVISIEMAVYGGLLPSRLHRMSIDECREKVMRIKTLKDIHPHVNIYVSNLIMRTPQYNSSDEEPEYYEDYGFRIFKQSWLRDKSNRDGLNKEEQEELEKILSEVPAEFIKDYEDRRKINVQVNEMVMELVKDGVIDFMSIPQDDAALYGYTALDQKVVMKKLSDHRLQFRVHTYPGADEVGITLCSRAVNLTNGVAPKIYIIFSSTLGPQIIPRYEDRPMFESMKAHIMAIGGRIVNRPEEADVILAVNSPGKEMSEAPLQDQKDVTYTSFRHLRTFVEDIKYYIDRGKKVVVSDAAFGNGGDKELVIMLDTIGYLDKLHGYAGWNTHCNTLGTALGMLSMVCQPSVNREAVTYNLIFRLMEDVVYQSIVRPRACEEVLPKYNADWGRFNGHEREIVEEIRQLMNSTFRSMFSNSFRDINFELARVYSPWHRMFETGFEIEILDKGK